MDLNASSIAESSSRCFTSFNQDIRQSASVHPREYSLIENELVRFSIWTSSIGAFAPGRASVDHRLREVPEVRDVVIGLLNSLNEGTEECESFFPKFRSHSN